MQMWSDSLLHFLPLLLFFLLNLCFWVHGEKKRRLLPRAACYTAVLSKQEWAGSWSRSLSHEHTFGAFRSLNKHSTPTPPPSPPFSTLHGQAQQPFFTEGGMGCGWGVPSCLTIKLWLLPGMFLCWPLKSLLVWSAFASPGCCYPPFTAFLPPGSLRRDVGKDFASALSVTCFSPGALRSR